VCEQRRRGPALGRRVHEHEPRLRKLKHERCEAGEQARSTEGIMAPPPPPSTYSSVAKRRFGVEAEKQLARLLYDPNLLPVEPAPLRRSRLDADRPATERELRDALDRRVPAKLLFQYRQSHSTSDVDLKTWETRWKPVLLAEKTPDPRKRPQLPPGKRPVAPKVAIPEPPKLARSVIAPHPVPDLTQAYKDPKMLLSNPGSLEEVRHTTEQERRRNERRHKHKLHVARQVGHRLPRPGEQYAAEAAGTVSSSCASSFPQSSVNSTLRRWSKPDQAPTAPLDDGAGGGQSEMEKRLLAVFAGSERLSRELLVEALKSDGRLAAALEVTPDVCKRALDEFGMGFDEGEEVTREEFVSYFAEQIQPLVASLSASGSLPTGHLRPMPSLASTTSNWSVGSFVSMASVPPSVGAVASDWGVGDEWKGVDPTIKLQQLRPVTPPAGSASGRPFTSSSSPATTHRPGTSGGRSVAMSMSIASSRPSTSGAVSAMSIGSQSARSHVSSPGGSRRSRQQRDSRSMSPRHRRKPEVELILQEVMGSKYPGPPQDYKLLPMPPRRPPPQPPKPREKETIWGQLSGELSFERDNHAKLANAKLRDGALTDALDKLTVAIDRHDGVESTSDHRAQRGEERPSTSEAAARLVEQRSFYYLVAGDVDAALADANTAIEMSAGHPLGSAKAHYRKALAIHARTTHVVNKKEESDAAAKRRAMKYEALRSVSQALKHSPTDSRYKKLYHRLWREINTDFSDSVSDTFSNKLPMQPPEAGARIKPPTPPPKTQEKKKGDWSAIDLSDITAVQTELREAVGGIQEQIESGSVPDAKQQYAFSRVMKKSNVPNKLATQLLGAIEASGTTAADDGDGDGDGGEGSSTAPGAEAMTALSSLRPRDSADEWAAIIEILEKERGFMMVVFRFYCVEGGATDASASDSMNLSQWIRFCKDAGFGSANQPGLSSSELPLIFLRANQDKQEEEEFTSIKKLVKMKSKDTRTDNEDEMVFHEFVEGCIRVAYHWKRDVTGVANRLQMLVDEKIKAHKCFSQLSDDIDERMESSEIQAVLEAHDGPLKQIFVHYAAADKTSFDGAEQDTINMIEWQQLMRECGLFDGVSTVRTATAAFVKVNMDDDLYDDAGGEEGDSAEELVYDEFVECVVRVAAERERTKKNLHTNEQDDGRFAEMAEAFIREELVPMFMTRVKGKSKGKKTLKAASKVLGMLGGK
jgi:hypothetical protein